MIRISGATFSEKRLMRRVEKACMREVGQENFFVIDVTVADEESIKKLNAEARGVDKVTDVLSFPCFDSLSLPVTKENFAPCDFEGKRVPMGSIMICRQRAREQAEDFNHSYARELGFLTCHGILHLLGYDHVEKDDEETMTDLQRRVMDGVGLKR